VLIQCVNEYVCCSLVHLLRLSICSVAGPAALRVAILCTWRPSRSLSDRELPWFWKFRAPGDEGPPELVQLHEEPDEQRRSALRRGLELWGKSPTCSDAGRGVAYFLDEAHIAFNARQWATVCSAALFYLSQHRKLGDIVFAVTQSSGNLDKQFRSVAEDFSVIRNEYVAQYWVFRGRGRFVRKTYLQEPSANAEPFERASFQVDGVAGCYDTARGVGVHGSKADIGRRAKGISIMWVVPAFMLLAILCVAVPWGLGKASQSFIAGEKGEKVDTTKKDSLQESPAVAVHPVAQSVANQEKIGVRPGLAPGASPGRGLEQLSVRGYVVRGGRVNVVLSDGRTLTERDAEVSAIDRHSATVDGRKLYLVRPESRPPAPEMPKLPPAGSSANTSTREYRGEQLFEPSDSLGRPPAVTLPSAGSAGGAGRGGARPASRGSVPVSGS